MMLYKKIAKNSKFEFKCIKCGGKADIMKLYSNKAVLTGWRTDCMIEYCFSCFKKEFPDHREVKDEKRG